MSYFSLNKWCLDFIGEDGSAMIFYSAQLTWCGLTIPYTSIIEYNTDKGSNQSTWYSHANLPEKREDLVLWKDERTGIEGVWEAKSNKLNSRLYDSEHGYLDWNCFQPYSKTSLNINGTEKNGWGYAEQLIMTTLPWKIPMNELRWGHFISEKYYIVWIEIREKNRQMWLWLNGDSITGFSVSDEKLEIPSKRLIITFDRSVVLESENKILSVAHHLTQTIPGFNRLMPIKFLMANETKWFSKGIVLENGVLVQSGKAIHEFVDFSPA